MIDDKFRKTINQKGNLDFPVSPGDSVYLIIKLYKIQQVIDAEKEQMVILIEKYVPNYLISLVSAMYLNEISVFFIPQKYYSQHLSAWMGYKSESNINMLISVQYISNPIDILHDMNYIFRLTSIPSGKKAPHTKSKYLISARIEKDRKVLMEISEKVVRVNELPYIWQESLKQMSEGDKACIECNIDNPNRLYLNSSETVFDVDRYCDTGFISIFIIVHRFINGRSVFKDVKAYCGQIFASTEEFFKAKDYESTIKGYKVILEYLDRFNDEIFEQIKRFALKNLILPYIMLKRYSDAEAICDLLITSGYSDFIIHYRRAVSKTGLKKFQDSLNELLKLKSNPEVPSNLLTLIDQELTKIDIIQNQRKYWKID